MAKDLTLARRVQLAALAYIRHTKTRYDELLRETDWANARKAVEKPCLDTIVKWRGDEETGRDQLDEILREVIEISDSEDDSEDETSSPGGVSVRNTGTISPALYASVDIAPRNIPIATGPTLARGHRHASARGDPSTPARPKAMTRMERRTARKAAQRFKRYAAVAESIANEHGHNNGHNDIDTTSRLPTIVDLTSSPASHRPVRSTVEALPAAYHVLSPGQDTSRAQLGSESIRFTPSLPGEATNRRPHDFFEDRRHPASPPLIRIHESQRPKVGPSPAPQDHPRAAVSPITAGLQDMLLPSIEPRSPNVPEYHQYAFRTLHREYQERTEGSRIVSRTTQSGGLLSRPRSRPFGHDDDERAVKRSRIATYFPEDYDIPSSSSFITLSHAHAGQGSRLAPFEHSPAGVPMARRVENARPEQPMTVSAREYLPYDRDDAPVRTRANPIVIENDNPFRPQRVFEVRERQAPERLGVDLSRKREVVCDPTLAPSRIHHMERGYQDERVVADYRHDNVRHNYVEPASRRLQGSMLSSPSMESGAQRNINKPQPYCEPVQYREMPQDHHYLRQPIEHAGNSHREVRSVPQGFGRFEM